jgi:signal transduction histidine kinase/Na+/proline symporter
MSAAALLGLTVAYLGALYLVAGWVDRRARAQQSFALPPLVSALSLGVYATSWTFFGSVGVAASDGYRFLAIFIGASISCALVPVLWAPLASLCRERQLGSVADLLAYRFQSRGVGALTTLLLLAGSLPYQALQLRAAVEAVAGLGSALARTVIALAITALLVGFANLYGVRHLSPAARHHGFVAVVALESLVKLAALLAVAGYALYGVFGGFAGLADYLAAHPEATRGLIEPARSESWLPDLFLATAAMFLLPRQWHLAITEGSARGLRAATWALPLYLLLMNLTVPILLWGGRALGLPGSPEFYSLGLARGSGSLLLSSLVFLGALSAAGAMIVVTTVALANMLQNQLVLPLTGIPADDLYRRLRWLRRALVTCIIIAGHGMYVLLEDGSRLAELGLASFVAVAQLLPGLVGVLLWSRMTARGVSFGIALGGLAWLATPILPLLARAGALPAHLDWPAGIGLHGDSWGFTTCFTLGLNAFACVLGSLLRAPHANELAAAAVCRHGSQGADDAGVEAGSSREFIERLEPALGVEAASAEVRRSLARLGLSDDERRPEQLRALRDELEKNLSGLLGPVTARMIVDERIALDSSLRSLLSSQLRYVEEQLSALRLTGPARALEQARQFLRDLLEELPIGVCALGPAGDVALWNQTMAQVTGLEAERTLGLRLAQLATPWADALAGFVRSEQHDAEISVAVAERTRTLVLHRAAVDSEAAPGGIVILLEDRTRERDLAAQLAHQDRLASIGRFAAGVAHEIGNPLTGITSLAQNLTAEAHDDDVRERLRLLLSQAKRIDGIVGALVGFARGGEAPRGLAAQAPVALADVVQDAVTLVQLGRTVVIQTEIEAGLTVRGDRQRLGQVLVNLLTNAADASQGTHPVRIEATSRPQGGIRLCVIDRGSGMPEDVRARAFEPFFTTKGPGEGTGLGLSLTHGIVAEHGGSIALDSTSGEGTRVIVELPT